MMLSLVSYACDIALWLLFMRGFPRRAAKHAALLLALPLAVYSLHRLRLLFWVEENAGWINVAEMAAAILLCVLLGRLWVGLGPKSALLEAMIFCIAVHVGRRTQFYVLRPLTSAWIGAYGQPFVMGVAKAFFVLLLLPGEDPLTDDDIAPHHLIPFGFAVFVCLAMGTADISTGFSLYIILVCYLSAFVCTWLEKRAIERDRRLLRLRSIEENMRLQYDLARQQLRDEAMIRRMVHDLKHQLAALEAGAHGKEALQELRDSLERARPASYSDSPVLNAILNERMRQAGEQGIDMRIESRFGAFPMLSELEVSTLFSNALANALEATALSEEKWIRCRYNETTDFAVVVLQNASPAVLRDAAGRIVSRKGGEMHGIGLTSMEAIARGCGGSMRADAEDGVFTLTLMLPKGGA